MEIIPTTSRWVTRGLHPRRLHADCHPDPNQVSAVIISGINVLYIRPVYLANRLPRHQEPALDVTTRSTRSSVSLKTSTPLLSLALVELGKLPSASPSSIMSVSNDGSATTDGSSAATSSPRPARISWAGCLKSSVRVSITLRAWPASVRSYHPRRPSLSLTMQSPSSIHR